MRSVQLIPGHEAIGKVVEMGRNVKGFEIGDRVVADVGISVSDRKDARSTGRLADIV